jgi:hypothetical protein
MELLTQVLLMKVYIVAFGVNRRTEGLGRSDLSPTVNLCTKI